MRKDLSFGFKDETRVSLGHSAAALEQVGERDWEDDVWGEGGSTGWGGEGERGLANTLVAITKTIKSIIYQRDV